MEEFEILDEDDEDGESTAAEIVYNDIDMIELRKNLKCGLTIKILVILILNRHYFHNQYWYYIMGISSK